MPDAALWGLTALLAVVAAKRIVLQSLELLSGTSYGAAFDLRLRYDETIRWLSGASMADVKGMDYPPATYAVLGPLIGHLGWPAARALWLVLCLVALAMLSVIAVRAVERRPATRCLAAVLPWAMYGSALTVGVGQLGLICLATGLGGVLLAYKAGSKALRGSLAGFLFALSLVKPTLTAPWFWLLIPASPVAAGVAVILYGAATLAACANRPEPLAQLLTLWIHHGHLHVARGYGSVATWASDLGLDGWIVPLGLAMLAGLGLWIFRHRRADLWVLLGVSAFVARFFTYHYYVDDLLFLIPLIALFRLVTRDRRDRAAAIVFLLGALSQLTPTRWFTELGPRIESATEMSQILLWVAAVAVLIRACREKTAP